MSFSNFILDIFKSIWIKVSYFSNSSNQEFTKIETRLTNAKKIQPKDKTRKSKKKKEKKFIKEINK